MTWAASPTSPIPRTASMPPLPHVHLNCLALLVFRLQRLQTLQRPIESTKVLHLENHLARGRLSGFLFPEPRPLKIGPAFHDLALRQTRLTQHLYGLTRQLSHLRK